MRVIAAVIDHASSYGHLDSGAGIQRLQAISFCALQSQFGALHLEPTRGSLDGGKQAEDDAGQYKGKTIADLTQTRWSYDSTHRFPSACG
jgi:hypothetical protein